MDIETKKNPTIEQLKLVKTCSCSPEQYSVFLESGGSSSKVAYLRLRHGYFYAALPDAGAKLSIRHTQAEMAVSMMAKGNSI